MYTKVVGICGPAPSAPEGQELSVHEVAVSMQDGWASIGTTEYATVGEFVTVPLSFHGSELVVNAACGGHRTLKVAILNAENEGKHDPCFALERAVPMWATSLRESIRWDQTKRKGSYSGI